LLLILTFRKTNTNLPFFQDSQSLLIDAEVKVSQNGPERRSGKRIVAGMAFRLEFQVH